MEPFGFFTLDALRAGWYLVWRQAIRVVPVAFVAVFLGVFVGPRGLGPLAVVLMAIGILAAVIWAIVLVPKLASQWAEERYGHALEGPVAVWWGITWRSIVASLVAAVVFTPPNMVAMSLKTSFAGSFLGLVGGLLTVLLGVANFGVTLLATGWAMSKVAAAQLGDLVEMAPLVAARLGPTVAAGRPEPPVLAGVSVAEPVATAAPAAAPRPSPRPSPVATPATAADTQQCPKCGLYETERGSVIGWYCRICGWRESRR